MGSGRLIQFVTVMILAKLLLPEEFGLVALGLILINFLVIFRELGLGAALIQRQRDLDEAYTSALIIFPLVGIVLYGIAFLAAPAAAMFFQQSDAMAVIRLMGITIPIAGLGVLPETLIRKSLTFQRKLFPELSAAVGYGVVAIYLAHVGYGAFSIVYGQIVSESIRSVGYWISCPVRFRWKPSFRVAGQILGFGQKVTMGSLSIYVFNNMDQFSIGKLLGDAALGFYSFAFRLANFPTVNITHVINQVLLPTFSLLQSDRKRFRVRYLTTTQLIMLVTIPLAVGFIIFGRDLLYLLYGDKWLPAVVVLQVLAVYGMLRSVGSTYGNVLIVSAKPEWLFYGAGIQILIAVTAIILGASDYGIESVAVVMTGSLLVGIVFNGVKVSKILGLKFGSWLRIVGLPFAISLVIIGVITFIFPGGSWAWFMARIAAVSLSYIFVVMALYRDEISEVRHTIRSTFESKKKFM